MECWNGHGKLGDVVDVEPDAIEAIGNVHFDELHRSMVGVGVHNGLEDPLESFAELHCLSRCHFDRLIVESLEGVIDDYSRSSSSLRDYTHGTDAQVTDQALVFLEQPIR